jgi:putative oxidoreductase
MPPDRGRNLGDDAMKSSLNDLALLLLRLGLGAVMSAHGAQKLLGLFGGHGPQEFVRLVGTLGMPASLAWLVIAVEFFGGIAIVFGVLSRLAALGFAVEMVVAMFKLQGAIGLFMTGAGAGGRGAGYEYPLLLAVVAFVLLLTGPGRFALFGKTQKLLA